MSARPVLAVGFLLILGATLLFPSFPPAQMLYEYLKISPTTISIWQIPFASILNGITNGLFWMLIAAIVYAAAQRAQGSEPLPPMPVAPRLTTPPPTPMLVDPRVDKIPPVLTVPSIITVRKEPVALDLDIETIEGIGSVIGGLLRNMGINTVGDLLRIGANERGRRYLANEVGVTYVTMLKWVYSGDLLRVSGIGEKYSALLETAGVSSVIDLSMRSPSYLLQTIRVVNRERNIVKRTPPLKTVETWVSNAKRLRPVVQ